VAASAGSALLSRCTFCGKPSAEVAKLIAGPGVYICNECVGLCNDILALQGPDADQAERPVVPRIHPWDAMSDDELLGHIPRVAATVVGVEADLGQWVDELRDRGVTWVRIGSALGVTRQSAWERFGGDD
jgi:hypothetical protein